MTNALLVPVLRGPLLPREMGKEGSLFLIGQAGVKSRRWRFSGQVVIHSHTLHASMILRLLSG
jgi:hypothetical protein